jgi:ornithine carbamoyltransferase
MQPRHFLSNFDVSPAAVRELLLLAHRIKTDIPAWRGALAGQTLALIFQKHSTRTRISFEVGMAQLGGHGLFLSSQDLQIGRGETIADTARVISRYCNGIMARVYGHSTLTELAAHATVPVINGLSDLLHPCQALADAFTLVEKWSQPRSFAPEVLRGRKLAFVGDGNNVAHSLLEIGAQVGLHVSVVAPVGYWPNEAVLARARVAAAETGARLEVTADVAAGVAGADVIYTDVWASMGQEAEHARRLAAFAGYQVDPRLMAQAGPGCLFMHCLPAHRGEEVATEVADSPQSVIFDQAENRMHAQKALLVELMGRAR